MITVLIPLYNKAVQITRTLESVRQQTFTDYEMVIVDDGSTDGSGTIVAAYLALHPAFAARIRMYRQPNLGVSAARNRGIAQSKREWIAFLDADDRWHPTYLQTMYDMSGRFPGGKVLGAAYQICTAPDRCNTAQIRHLQGTGTEVQLDNYFVVASSSDPPLTSSSTMVSRRAIQAINGFPQGIHSGEDLLTWARLALSCKIAYHKHPLVFLTRDRQEFNDDQRSRTPDQTDQVGKAFQQLYRSHPQVAGLKKYVGKWYKMRTRIYLAAGQRNAALREWRRWGRYEREGCKRWVFLLFIFLPFKLLR